MPNGIIAKDIISVGVTDWNRESFDHLIPLNDGTSYNSYIVKGSEKIALIDTVDPAFEEEYISNLIMAGIGQVDYIVVNHAEQDHSGLIPIAVELFPMAEIVTTDKCRQILIALYQIPENRFKIVEDRESISLGDRTLEFIHAPWVHWPETMLTYLKEDKILFTCDLFGSHYASGDLFAADERAIYGPAKLYYATIMMPFRDHIRKHMERLDKMDIAIIAPSHGPLYKNPAFIMDAYKDWTSDDVKNQVIIPFVSMHGSTERMVDVLTRLLLSRGISARPYDLSKNNIGKIATSLVDAATVVFATPTVLTGPHPLAANLAFIANILKPKAKFASVIGSYGWGGKTIKDLVAMMPRIDAEFIKPVYIKGYPDEDAQDELVRLADEILERHKELGII